MKIDKPVITFIILVLLIFSVNIIYFINKPLDTSSYGQITDKEIKKLITIETSNTIYLNNPMKITTDKNYSLLTLEQMETFLKNDKLNYRKLKEESFDCDDFSFVLLGRMKQKFKGFAIGIMFSYDHAYNIFIDENRIVYIIEPQTDKITKLNEMEDEIYLPIKMFII